MKKQDGGLACLEGMRKAIVCVYGAWYHVVARTNRKELLMESSVVKEMFLEVLIRAKEKYCFHIDNFIVVKNHFHLLTKPLAGDSLAVIMRYIMRVYAMADAKFLQVYQNSDDNAGTAGLVKRPELWPHHRQSIATIIEFLLQWSPFLISGHWDLSMPKPVSTV